MMEALTLAQAIRNAIGAEEAAAAFYKILSERLDDPEACGFLAGMSSDERGHADALRRLALTLTDEPLPAAAEPFYEQVELPPVSFFARDFDLQESYSLALSGEYRARDFYETLARDTEGSLNQLFETLAAAESQHAIRLRSLLGEEAS